MGCTQPDAVNEPFTVPPPFLLPTCPSEKFVMVPPWLLPIAVSITSRGALHDVANESSPSSS